MKFISVLIFVTFSTIVTASTSLAVEPTNSARTATEKESLGTHLSIRDYLEMISFGATIATAIVAMIALSQLRLARLQLKVGTEALSVAQEDIKIRSRREAVALAAERCEDLGNVKFPIIRLAEGD